MTKTEFSIASALLIAISLPLAQAANKKDPGATIQDLEQSAFDAELRADSLSVAYNLSWQTHSTYLNALRDDINRMGRDLRSLDDRFDSLAPWQKKAVNKVEPMLKDAAANTDHAVDFFNEHRNELWSEDYRGYITSLFDESRQIADTLKDYLKYAKAHNQEQQLKEILEGGLQ